MSRNFDLSQAPSDGILIFPDYPPSPTVGTLVSVGTVTGAKTKLAFTNPSASYLPITGGTMTGPLFLVRDPVSDPMEAVNKRYSDTKLALAGGQMSGFLSLSGDPTQPLHAVTKQYSDTKLALAGGTMTGLLTLSGDPVNPLQAVTKRYVDTTLSANYLPITGGTLTTPGTLAGVASITFTSGDIVGPPTLIFPDLAWGLVDTDGDVAVMLDKSGVFTVAAISGTVTADPTVPLGIASKQYIDNLRSNSLPLQGGTASAGVSLFVSRADHTHPPDASTWAPVTAPVFQTSITLGSETWLASAVEPEFVWSLRDSPGGNIVVALDYTGVLNVAALNVPTITGLLNLSAANATLTQATIANETIADQSMPDLIGAVAGSNGNIVSGYDAQTGEFNAVSVNAGAVKVNGQPLSVSFPTAPTDALDVKSYGAVGGATSNHGYATTSGGTLTITNFTGTLSLSAFDATHALLAIVSARWSGWAFQAKHVGKLCYLSVSGYSLTARVTQYRSGREVLLDVTGVTITPQTGVAGTVTCPAVDTSKPTANNVLVVEGMGQDMWYQQTPTLVKKADTVTPYGTQAFLATITGYPAPNQVAISGTFPFAWTNIPTRMLWGVNDSAAVIACGAAAWPAKRRIWFSGDDLYLLPGLVGASANRNAYISAAAGDPGPVCNGVLWHGDNSDVYACTSGGQRLLHRISTTSAQRMNDVPKLIHGRSSFPRCSQLTTINVLFSGDSLATDNPQSQMSQVMGAKRFMEEFTAQNPGKTINYYNVGIGGATWASLADPNTAFSNAQTTGPYPYFIIPKPIVGTVRYSDFFSNINRTSTAATNPIVPDLVVFFECAANDKQGISSNALHALVNLARATTHADGFGPTDVIMQVEHHGATIITNNDGPASGSTLPGAADPQWWELYSGQLNRTTAAVRGFGLVDYVPLIDRACFGFDPTRRAMRQVPSVTLNMTPTTQVSLAEQCLDFGFWMATPAASDDAGWQALIQLELQLSLNPGNRAMIRRGANGNLWLGVSTFGLATTTTVSVTAGANTITLGAAPTIISGQLYAKGGWAQIYVTDGAIDFTGRANQCIVMPTGNGSGTANAQLQRNYIRTVLDASDVIPFERTHDVTDVGPITTAVSIGPNQFIPQDGLAMPDVVIFYPDGTVFNTQMAYGGYVSATQATLVDNAPQTLAATSVPMFLGRMSVKWFDTGLRPSTTSNTGIIEFSVGRGRLVLGYNPTTQTTTTHSSAIMRPIERFGAEFQPVVRAAGTQQIVLTNRFVDDDMPIASHTPIWHQRGIIDANSDWFQGGAGGHYGSAMRPVILDSLYATQNLTVS